MTTIVLAMSPKYATLVKRSLTKLREFEEVTTHVDIDAIVAEIESQERGGAMTFVRDEPQPKGAKAVAKKMAAAAREEVGA